MLHPNVIAPDWYKNPYADIVRPSNPQPLATVGGLQFKDMWPDVDFYGNGHEYNRQLVPEFWFRLRRWERFKSKKYVDYTLPNGTKVYAIGFGHSGHSGIWPSQEEIVNGDIELTFEQAWDILIQDVYAEYLPQLNKRIKVNITNYMLSGMMLTLFNMGETNFRKTTILDVLHTGKYLAACAAFLVLPDGQSVNNKARNKEGKLEVQNGLTVRRADEMSLYATRVDKEGVVV